MICFQKRPENAVDIKRDTIGCFSAAARQRVVHLIYITHSRLILFQLHSLWLALSTARLCGSVFLHCWLLVDYSYRWNGNGEFDRGGQLEQRQFIEHLLHRRGLDLKMVSEQLATHRLELEVPDTIGVIWKPASWIVINLLLEGSLLVQSNRFTPFKLSE